MRKSSYRTGSRSAALCRRASDGVARFLVEGLERRVLLSSAIAAFGAQQTFATGTGSQAVAVGDFNSDGKPDMVVANFSSGNVSVLLGNGNGTFQTQQTFAAGTNPYAVAVADVNGDGKPDLVVANNGSASVSVLLGNGNGTFQAQQTCSAGNGAHSVAIADLNGDGNLDIAVANKTSGSVSVLVGNGDGTFQPQQTFAASAGTAAIAIADLNSDGKLDLVVANQSANSVGVFYGTGSGSFLAQVPYPLGAAGPDSVAVSDLNSDGKPDIIVANQTAGMVAVLLNSGTGTFADPQSMPVGSKPFFVAVSDVNGDGKPDLVTANYSSNSLSVLLGNGDGTFQPQVTFATGTKPAAVAIADVNGDGRADLLAPNYGDASVSVLLAEVPPAVVSINRGSPVGPITSGSTVSFTVTFSKPVIGVDASDFSFDFGNVAVGTPVVTQVSGSVYTVTVTANLLVDPNNPTGEIGLLLLDDHSIHDAVGNTLQNTAPTLVWQNDTVTPVLQPVSIAAGDLNGDGKPDVVTTGYNPTASNVSVLLGNGNGTFQAPLTLAAGAYPTSVAIADVNGDGKSDLVVANYQSGTVSILLGNGNGTFKPQQTFSAGSQPRKVAVADFNRDGRLDLVVDNVNANTVSVLLGNGNGTFQARQTFGAGNQPYSVRAADVNGDGIADLVVANFDGNNLVSVLLGNGNGTFQPRATFTAGGYPTGATAADVNGDGRVDLVVTDNVHAISVLLGNGNGTFQPPLTIDSIAESPAIEVADINGDGHPDLITTAGPPGLGGATAVVLLGNGNGTFLPSQSFGANSNTYAVAVSDLNGDGRPDLVAADHESQNVSVLLGAANGSFLGQDYFIVPLANSFELGQYQSQITLVQDPDHVHIDWLNSGTPIGQTNISDPTGLTINGNGIHGFIFLDFTNGSPLPKKLTLNGTLDLFWLPTVTNPLANATLDIGSSTIYVRYSNPESDPIALVRSYLQNGFNNGAWNGVGTPSTGAIQLSTAAGNTQNLSIGYADSADVGQPFELTITLKVVPIGDTNLNGTVDANDYAAVVRNFGTGTNWDQGVVTYDGTVSANDYAAVVRNFGNVVTAQSPTPAAASSSTTASTISRALASTLSPTTADDTTRKSAKVTAKTKAKATPLLKPAKTGKMKHGK